MAPSTVDTFCPLGCNGYHQLLRCNMCDALPYRSPQKQVPTHLLWHPVRTALTGRKRVANPYQSEQPGKCPTTVAVDHFPARETLFSINTDGDKPHACDLCNKKFALACNLRAHTKTHEGEPQEECTNCGKIYLTNGSEQSCPNCRDQSKPVYSAEDSSGNHTEDSNYPPE